jgi:hypothetical protein
VIIENGITVNTLKNVWENLNIKVSIGAIEKTKYNPMIKMNAGMTSGTVVKYCEVLLVIYY